MRMLYFTSCYLNLILAVASLEIPNNDEGTYHAEETIEDDPNLEVIPYFFYKRVILFCKI